MVIREANKNSFDRMKKLKEMEVYKRMISQHT